MTEEIIIDGVNVVGWTDEEVYYKFEHHTSKAIKQIAFDLYKRLKRLEQERDELKFENDRYKQLLKGCPTEDEDCGLCVIDEQNKRLKQENKELKISNSNLDDQLHRTIKMMNNCNNRLQNYRSVLEEILESVKFAQCLPCGSGNLEDCLNCNDDTTNNGQFCMEKRIHEIKTKCVEVLNDK